MIKNFLKKESRFDFFAILIIVVWGTIIYSNSFDSPFQFDDRSFILQNPAIKHLSDIKSIISYKPQRWVAYFTFALDYALSGNKVFSYHLFNLIIHLLNSILIYYFLRLILNLPSFKIDRFQNSKKIIPFFTSLLFLVHPVQIEAITYIYQRFTPLATFFYLLSLIFYLKYRLCRGQACLSPTNYKGEETSPLQSKKFALGRERSRPFPTDKSTKKSKNKSSENLQVKKPKFLKSGIFYIFCLLSLFFGMFSKEEMFTAPIMIILIEIYFISGFKVGTEQCSVPTRWKTLIPILLTLLIIPLTYIFIVKGMAFSNINLNKISRDTFIYSRSTYLLTEFNVLIKYLQLFFFPIVLNLDYDFPISKTLFEYPTFFSFLIICSLLILGIILYKKHRLISFGIIWFFVTISITSSILPIKDVIFEHRMYIPSIGLSIALIFMLYQIFPDTMTKSPWGVRRLLSILLIIIAIAFSILTHKRNEVWRDDVSLWQDTVNKSPNKARVHNNLANALVREGKLDRAIKHYLETLRITPLSPETYNNMGIALYKQGKIDEAMKYYSDAIRLKPDYADAHSNLGSALVRNGKYDEAIDHYYQAVKYNPQLAQVYTNIGNLVAREGRFDEAIANYSKTIELNPDYAEAYNNWGQVLIQKGQVNEGIEKFYKAIQLDPKYVNAHFNLAFYLSQLDKTEEAIAHYLEVIRINPNYAEAHNNLGTILTREDKIEEANTHFSEAIRINPDYVQAHRNLAENLIKSRKIEDAIKHLLEILRINPEDARIHQELGDAMILQGKSEEAIRYYRKAFQLSPDSHYIANKLAWSLATSEDAKLRNADEAIKFAEFACQKTNYNDPVLLDTLAAAYAEAKRFEEAIKTAQKALDLAQSRKQENIIKEIQGRLQLYKSNQPFYETHQSTNK